MVKEIMKNLLIIGYAGGGKSTLANMLSNTVDFEKYSDKIQKKDFEWKGTKYRVVVVDTIGSIKMIEVSNLIPEGISQILLVIDGKFTAEEISRFDLLKDFIFESGIDEYITIVRTKFSNFKNENECKKDKEALCKENEIIAKLCKSIIYVDNPPINIEVDDEDDEETIRINRRRRDQSRAILLDHLDKVCHKFKMWDNLCA